MKKFFGYLLIISIIGLFFYGIFYISTLKKGGNPLFDSPTYGNSDTLKKVKELAEKEISDFGLKANKISSTFLPLEGLYKVEGKIINTDIKFSRYYTGKSKLLKQPTLMDTLKEGIYKSYRKNFEKDVNAWLKKDFANLGITDFTLLGSWDIKKDENLTREDILSLVKGYNSSTFQKSVKEYHAALLLPKDRLNSKTISDALKKMDEVFREHKMDVKNYIVSDRDTYLRPDKVNYGILTFTLDEISTDNLKELTDKKIKSNEDNYKNILNSSNTVEK